MEIDVAWTSYGEAGREKLMNPKRILEVESSIFVNELDVEDEKEWGVCPE